MTEAGGSTDTTDPSAVQRSCGTCSFCCKVMAVEELAKPMGAWCAHRSPGRGCGIHGSHPPSCQGFACQWLLEPAMPHRLRPDQTKVVLTAEAEGARLVANCDPANPAAWRRGPIYDFLKQQARATWGSGRTVLAKAGRRLWLIAPEEDVDLGEVHPRSPLRIEQPSRGGPVKVTVLPPIPQGMSLAARLADLPGGPT